MKDRTTRLLADVQRLYQLNRRQGYARWCDREFDFVCPSRVRYPFQWFWDSCFHAIVLSHWDPQRAEAEIWSLLAGQQGDGFIPHVIFWEREVHQAVLATYNIAYRTPYLSDCIQPPVLGIAVEAVARRGRGTAFLREVLPAVLRYFDWCQQNRDPDEDGLIAVIQPDETGLDHSPKFDEYLEIPPEQRSNKGAFDAAWRRVAQAHHGVGRRLDQVFALDRFVVEDVMVNTLYAESQAILADLCERIGDHQHAVDFRQRSQRTTTSLLSKCWDPERGLFFDLAGAQERPLMTNTVTCLVPLLLAALDTDRVERLVQHLSDPHEYAAPFPVPSVAMNEPAFSPDDHGGLIWRGSTWVNTNWLITRGLRRHDHAALATEIEDRTIALWERSGFREHYNPFTGEGYGAPDFSWSALILDMILSREEH